MSSVICQSSASDGALVSSADMPERGIMELMLYRVPLPEDQSDKFNARPGHPINPAGVGKLVVDDNPIVGHKKPSPGCAFFSVKKQFEKLTLGEFLKPDPKETNSKQKDFEKTEKKVYYDNRAAGCLGGCKGCAEKMRRILKSLKKL
ncbi:hypothetical protein A6R68_13127 [Neotoma lepida]|uniref:Uncharacterized protein n=1 Tax=Neotoma lepida TaxID=56216 RepID=A0A1A6H1Y7_NEOLE|nr:hypothetical protein A6R68_13127 [Neotoma lepida]